MIEPGAHQKHLVSFCGLKAGVLGQNQLSQNPWCESHIWESIKLCRVIQMCNRGYELLTSHFTGKEVSAQSCSYSCLSIFIYVFPFKEIQTIGKVQVGFFFKDRTTRQCCTLHIHCICESPQKNPLQYSCLENAKDRGAWGATVHSVEKSWT